MIELDGGGHNEDATRDYDRLRTMALEGSGLMVIRFWNNDVLSNIEGVLETIYQQVLELSESPSPPAPLPGGEGRKTHLPTYIPSEEEGHSLPSPTGRGWPTSRVRVEGGRRPDEVNSINSMHPPVEERSFMNSVLQGFTDIEEGRTLILADAKTRLGLP